jgi:hypothetical protein
MRAPVFGSEDWHFERHKHRRRFEAKARIQPNENPECETLGQSHCRTERRQSPLGVEGRINPEMNRQVAGLGALVLLRH